MQNVRGFIYQPQREGAELSALIVWDPLMGVASGGFVQNYIISVFEQGGSELPVSAVYSVCVCVCVCACVCE